MSDYQEFRVVYEIISAILCFTLVWFMMKPYRFTKTGRYMALPIAFGLLGASYLFSAIIYSELPLFLEDMFWFQLVARTFAFVFLAATYMFSKQNSERGQLLWNVTFSVIIVAIITAVAAIIFLPVLNFENYLVFSSYVRIFIIVALAYVIYCTLRRHMTRPDSTTLLTPLGFILLAFSQYSLIIWAVDRSMIAWWGALALRWAGLAIFLSVTYLIFYASKKAKK